MCLVKRSILILGVLVLVAGSGLASGNDKKAKGGIPMPQNGPVNAKLVFDPKGVVDPKLVVNPKLVIDPKVVVDPKKVVNPKVLIDAKVINPKGIIVDPKKVVDPKVSKIIIDPKIGVDPKVVNPKVIIDPKISKVIVDPKYSKVIVTKVIVAQGPQVIILPIFGQVPVFENIGWGVPVQTERYLRLHNTTDAKMTVYLRNHTADVTGAFEWIPEAPAVNASKWLAFELAPGEVMQPMLGEMPIAANRIRFFVDTAGQRQASYMDDDFWLVPETTPLGEHLYYSEGRQTYDLYLGGMK